MPELPEVESTVRFLRERVIGEVLSSIHVHWARSLSPLSLAGYANLLRGSAIERVERRGKYIVMEVASGSSRRGSRFYVLVHLRMSGNLDVVPHGVPLHSHDRVVFGFESGRELRFNDTRKFGRVYVVSDPQKVVGALGVEPLSSEFTPRSLGVILEKKKRALKPLLLDQTLIAGIGNIYADEALWRAGLHPLTVGYKVEPSKCELLHRVIQEILHEAIDSQGTDFGDGVVEMGNYAPAVYGRGDEPCKRCGTRIVRMVVGQRGTHFCPRCQPQPRGTKQKLRRSNPGSPQTVARLVSASSRRKKRR